MKTSISQFPFVFTLLVALGLPALAAPAASPPRDPEAVPEGLAKSDWQSIRAAYAAGRHAFQPVAGGWQARNPGQQWTTKFDGRGFIAEPKDGGWQWGLELQSYGFGKEQHAIGGTPAVQAAGTRLAYQWDAAVQEWWVNDARGLEHGFTIKKRPEREPQDGKDQKDTRDGAESLPSLLSFSLKTRGTLHPRVAADAQGVLFEDASGATVINYTGLKVTDADGKVLVSRFEAAGELSVRLLIEERTARYPITIDPIAQQAYLKPADVGNAIAGDNFGVSVAVSGDTVVVGANLEDSSTTGVNSTPDESAADAGAAYVFVRVAGVWSQEAYLKPAAVGTTQAGDLFGYAVAIAGDTIVVGAPLEDSEGPGVANELGPDAGAAYVFTRSGVTWTQGKYLKPLDYGTTQAGDHFGVSVAVSGDTVVVGSPQEDSGSTGVNSAPDESAANSGAAYVFTGSGTTWNQQAYLKPSAVGSAQTADEFGTSVAVSGNSVVVGASDEDSSTAGVNSTPNESAAGSGAAYIFVRSAGVWTQQAFLKPAAVGTSQAGDRFGTSVAVSGDTAVVGSPREDSSTTGVNSTANDNGLLFNSGAAYVFVRSAGIWTQQAYLKPAAVGTSQAGDRFGDSVAVSGDTVVVGAPREGSSTTGVNSTPNESAADSGAAYVFTRSGVAWTQQAYLKTSAVGTAQAGDFFGNSVAASGDTVIVGALLEDSGSKGINSPPDENAADAGAAGVFVRSTGVWTPQAYLKPAVVGAAQAGDLFGYSVAVSGDTVVVGAIFEDSSTTGVNSTANDSGLLFNSGAAYVFVRSAGIWTQQAYLKPSAVGTSQADDRFGYSVAVSGDTVVVGANGEDSSTTGVNSTPNESASLSGAAYIFVRSAGVWTQQAYLKPAAVGTTQAGDAFGTSVAVAGDTVVVGANGEGSSTTGVNSTPNESSSASGAAYVFVRSTGVWTQQAYLKPAAVGTSQAGDQFGESVAVAGDTVVVGAYQEDSNTTGVNSTPNEGAFDSGAAYVFVRSAGVWTQQAYLKPAAVGTSQADDFFGTSVAIAGDTVVVGANGEDSSTTGVNSTPNESASSSGAACVFVRSGTTWTQQAYLKPAAVGTTQAGDNFGGAVAVSGDTVVVGAYLEDSSTTGVNSTPNESASSSGAAHVFVRSGTTWTHQAYLKPAAAGTTQASDQFGISVAVSGGTVVVGANGEDSSTTGVNSTPDESASASGTAYLFTLPPEIAVEQPAGTGLTSGISSIGFGPVPLGSSSAAKIFTIKAPVGTLTITSVNATGGNAADFTVNTAGMLTSVPGGSSTTFTVTFTPTAAGSRLTILRIVNSDSNEGIFDITLTGTALSFASDTDGDGLSDASEFNMAALGFDWQVSQPALVGTLYANSNGANLYTPAQVQALNVGVPLIQKNPTTGVFTLTIGVEKSTTLQPGSFSPFPMTTPQTLINGAGKLEFRFTVPDNAAFFRVQHSP